MMHGEISLNVIMKPVIAFPQPVRDKLNPESRSPALNATVSTNAVAVGSTCPSFLAFIYAAVQEMSYLRRDSLGLCCASNPKPLRAEWSGPAV
jgi:hypothetical protein